MKLFLQGPFYGPGISGISAGIILTHLHQQGANMSVFSTAGPIKRTHSIPDLDILLGKYSLNQSIDPRSLMAEHSLILHINPWNEMWNLTKSGVTNVAIGTCGSEIVKSQMANCALKLGLADFYADVELDEVKVHSAIKSIAEFESFAFITCDDKLAPDLMLIKQLLVKEVTEHVVLYVPEKYANISRVVEAIDKIESPGEVNLITDPLNLHEMMYLWKSPNCITPLACIDSNNKNQSLLEIFDSYGIGE